VFTYVALLRGINVSGQKKVPMAVLRDVFAGLGHTDVVTYIQSGNVVFDAEREDLDTLRREIEAAIVDEFGFDVPVVIRTSTQLASIIAASPYTQSGADSARLAVAFLNDVPVAGRAAMVDASGSPPDELALVRGEVYLHCPTGFGRTKLTNTFLEKRLGVTATTRNWKTVTKLAALADRG
jgi:uncharacterized protein (DUF1697 family)